MPAFILATELSNTVSIGVPPSEAVVVTDPFDDPPGWGPVSTGFIFLPAMPRQCSKPLPRLALPT